MAYLSESGSRFLELVTLLWIQLMFIVAGLCSITCYAVRRRRIVHSVQPKLPGARVRFHKHAKVRIPTPA